MSLLVRHEVVGAAATDDRLRIAHVSDLHVWWSARRLRAIDALLEGWRPDVIALTGDYADTWIGRDLFLQWLEGWTRRLPVCWVEGNHDRWWGNRFVARLRGVRAAHAIDHADCSVTTSAGRVVRITSWERWAQHRDEEPAVVLLHDPAVLRGDTLRAGGVSLVLAGHLHGGQVVLWTDRHGKPQPGALFYAWLEPRRTVGRATVIVSRGVGDTLPLRVGVPRELVMIDYAPA